MIKNENQKQLELFSGSVDPFHKSRYTDTMFQSRVHLNIEHVVVFSLIVLMAIVFSFSIGVEKGKRNINTVAEKRVIPPSENQAALKEMPAPTKVKEAIEKKEYLPAKEVFAYTIQVASFKKQANVQEEAGRLKNKGYETIIIPKGDWIILCVGKFVDKQEAARLLNKLKDKYKDCLIREL